MTAWREKVHSSASRLISLRAFCRAVEVKQIPQRAQERPVLVRSFSKFALHCSQDGRAGEDAARHERCWLSPPTFPSFPWLFLRELVLVGACAWGRWFRVPRV